MLTRFSIIFSILICGAAHYYLALWNTPGNVIHSDAASYYAYLPAYFIYKDLSLETLHRTKTSEAHKIMKFKKNNGKYLIKTSLGVALLQAPFFMVGHYVASLCSRYQANGYSPPYAFSLIISGLFYYFFGLYIIARILENYFSDIVVAVVTFLITWATNVSYYLLREPGMSHLYSFFLFALFCFLVIKWHRKQDITNSIFLGLVFGLITLVRPSNAIALIIFFLWNVDGAKSLKEKIFFFQRNYKFLILIFVLSVGVWTPQFLYWKLTTQNWIYYSYEKEGFFFLDPKIMAVLIGFRKGWLVYTPIMAMVLFGLPVLYFKNSRLFYAITLFMVINIYIISSWWCWWYGGSYGQRSFIEGYVFMCFPLAALVEFALLNNRIVLRTTVVLLSVFFLAHNMFQLLQLKNQALHMESMTKSAYFNSIGRLHPTKNFPLLLQEPNFTAARQGVSEKYW